MKYSEEILKDSVVYITGAVMYMGIEILFRGYTYLLMGLVGGLAFLLIGQINTKRNIGLLWQGLIGSAIVTFLELTVGSTLLTKGIRMWDYSGQWLNYKGLICPLFSLFWLFLSIAAAVLDDTLRHLLFGEAKREYTWT